MAKAAKAAAGNKSHFRVSDDAKRDATEFDAENVDAITAEAIALENENLDFKELPGDSDDPVKSIKAKLTPKKKGAKPVAGTEAL